MWPFKRKKKKSEIQEVDSDEKEKNTLPAKKGNRMEKIVMGAIMGVAIGSVIGASIKPKKNQPTKEKNNDKYLPNFKPKSKLGQLIRNKIDKDSSSRTDSEKAYKRIPNESE